VTIRAKIAEIMMLAAIDRALRAGQPCPTNDQFCSLLGYGSVSAPARVMRRLEAAGLVTTTHPNGCTRIVVITAAGQARLAQRPAGLAVPEILSNPRERRDRRVDVSKLPPVGDGEERAARKAAEAANDRFLAALRRVQVPPEPPAPAERELRQLPPPALTAGAFS
jgi:DNA-binding MarR family transcriptional regulator